MWNSQALLNYVMKETGLNVLEITNAVIITIIIIENYPSYLFFNERDCLHLIISDSTTAN